MDHIFEPFNSVSNRHSILRWLSWCVIMLMISMKMFITCNLTSNISALYALPVSMMVVYHTQLVLANLSTNEQSNIRRYRYFWSEGRFRNPFDHGKIRNILLRLSPDRSSYELNEMGGDDYEERQAMLADEV